jgi:hypothetical protein
VQVCLSPDASEGEIGHSLRSALNASRIFAADVPEFFDWKRMQEDYDSWIKTMMKRYNLKSKRALFRNLASVGVDVYHGKIVMRPRNHEKLQGWSGDGISPDDHVILPQDASEAELGAGVALALSRCI